MTYVCFDIGGTFIKYGAFDRYGTVIEKGKVKTEQATKSAFFSSLARIIAQFEKNFSIEGIGISFPGFVDPVSGEAILAGALTSLHGTNVKRELLAVLDYSYPIYIENDANCAALAEKFNGAAQNNQNFVLITLGTGVGGAIYVNNEILHGQSFRAGELGMMITDFGNSGYKTLHDLASTRALVARYQEIHSIENVTGEMIFADNHEKTLDMIQDWADQVAIGIFNVVVSLNPEKVLIGGGISQNSRLMPYIECGLGKIPYWQDFKVPVTTCFHHNDAGLIGALYLITRTEENS